MKNSQITPEQELQICNLVSDGKTVAEARKQVLEASNVISIGDTPEGEKPKLSAQDKKDAMTKEIEALGGEVPDPGASVAKFTEALTKAQADAEAKKAAEGEGEGNGGGDNTGADLM